MFFVCVFRPHDDEGEQSSDADYELVQSPRLFLIGNLGLQEVF